MENRFMPLTTEMVNLRSMHIDEMSTEEVLQLMNEEDQTIPKSVKEVLPQVEVAVNCIYDALKNGGRLFYIGAGTSGRIGILDAVECPPTFSTSPEMVQGIIAGGAGAIIQAVEGAEDNIEQGKIDLKQKQLSGKDVVLGIAASGTTPYVQGALQYGRDAGAATIALSCNKNSLISRIADHHIEVEVGPEIISGSTRLKAATAQKMILNMITTTTMIKLGKVYGNLMVDLHVSNEKLKNRARKIITLVAGVPYSTADKVLNQTNQQVKPAIVMLKAGVTYEAAVELLDQANGFVREAIHLAAAYHQKE